jgi:hypothetical protein
MVENFEIYEFCPLDNTKLECIIGEDGFVIDWHCSKCGNNFNLNDLEIKEVKVKKIDLDKWL